MLKCNLYKYIILDILFCLIEPIIFVNDNINSLRSDSISISHIDIKNNVLIINYSYLGGYETHSINLFSEIGFEETSPVQLRMWLIHYSYADTGKEVINGKVYFDLKSVAALYKSAYRSDNGVILFSIYDSNLSNYYLPQPRYEF